MTLAEAERMLILQTLALTKQNRTQAARVLGISIRTLRNKLHEYGIPPAVEFEKERIDVRDQYGAERLTDGRWQMVVDKDRPFGGNVALGNMTQYFIGAFWKRGTLYVGIEHKGFYGFCTYVNIGYAVEKLGLRAPDAGNVADWINAQLGYGDVPLQGTYDSKCVIRTKAESNVDREG